MSGTHKHFDEPTLLEAVLDGSAEALRAELRACAECSRRAAELESFASHLRGTLLDAPQTEFTSRTEQRFAERVLARTTREDLSRKGDLVLMAQFAVERLRASPALRVAAAVIVVHLCALPVLAWIVLRAPARQGVFSTSIETPPPAFPAETEREPEREITAPWPEVEPRAVEVEPSPRGEEPWRASLRRSDRASWAAAAPQPWADKLPADALSAMLWIRASRLHGLETPEWVLSRVPDGEPSRLAVWCDVLLDEWAATGERPLHLERLVARLAALPQFQRSRLVACTLQRAAALGAIAPERMAALAKADPRASEIAQRSAREPLESLWREALADHGDGGSAERTAALGAWGAGRK